MKEPMITVGFSSHHVEVLPFAREQMERHQVIVLEEPPSTNFTLMLEGKLSIDEYILELDSGFPEFERRMCSLLRELHHRGRRIIQVEPYLEKLLQIHELFAAGKSPDDVMHLAELREVYMAEKWATGTLIAYYARSMDSPFETVVDAVKEFARADASRLVLRERLRARAIASLRTPDEATYVEAGYIHYPLYRYLRQEAAGREKVRTVFLLAPVVKKLQGKRRNLGPGDVLTLHYSFHDRLGEDLARLLAARSLIYIKLINKEELLPGVSEAPHSEDEVRVNRLVDQLQLHDCRELYGKIRLATREGALELTEAYLEKRAPAHDNPRGP
ncbi:MAG: hypothetical protein ACLFVT_00030 [Syntrophobacteria bacterium]